MVMQTQRVTPRLPSRCAASKRARLRRRPGASWPRLRTKVGIPSLQPRPAEQISPVSQHPQPEPAPPTCRRQQALRRLLHAPPLIPQGRVERAGPPRPACCRRARSRRCHLHPRGGRGCHVRLRLVFVVWFRVYCLRITVSGFGLRFTVLGFEVQASGCRLSGGWAGL